jgi:LysR family pca operon transcriptional activator
MPSGLDSRIKFRHLLCFLEVARQGSVINAANTLSVSQPAVSKTLRELEETLDVKLFDRTGRGIQLSRFGEVFLRYAGASVTALRQGVESLAQARTAGGLTISVGALPTVSSGVLPNAVRLFKQDATGTIVRVVTGENEALRSLLRIGELDLVVGRLGVPENMSGLSFEYLFSDHIGFFVRPDHPLLQLDPFDLAAINDYTVLMPTEKAAIRPIVEQFLVASGLPTPPDHLETVSPVFGRSYTRNSDAVWIISSGVVAEDVADGLLTALPVDTSDTFGPVGLTTRADTPLSLPALMLMQSIREVAGSTAG